MLLVGGCSRSKQESTEGQVEAEVGKAPSAVADLKPTQGNQTKGHLTLTEEKNGVRIRGTISGLAENSAHGFHVHEKGDCSAPDAKSAGEHLNPNHAQHGKAESGPHHLGDMDNLKADSHGDVSVNVLISGAKLGDGSLDDLVGKAFIVHATADDYQTQPAGNSGPRIACGVIAKK